MTKPTIIVCRTARQKRAPGAVVVNPGCKLCEEPLQLSAEGQKQRLMFPDVPLMCNPCATAFVKQCESLGKPVDFIANSIAREALASGNPAIERNPLAQRIKKAGQS